MTPPNSAAVRRERLLAYATGDYPAWKRNLLIAGVVSEALREAGGRPILTGGTAVEAYTRGSYATQDIDIYLNHPHNPELRALMRALGFENEGGRHYIIPSTGIYIEFPGSRYEGDWNRISQITVADAENRSATIEMIGYEDIIMHRVDAVAATGSADDQLWAVRMMLLYWDELDWPYMAEWAKASRAGDAFAAVKAEAAALRAELTPDEMEK